MKLFLLPAAAFVLGCVLSFFAALFVIERMEFCGRPAVFALIAAFLFGGFFAWGFVAARLNPSK